jgi:pyruvate dehydrogenase E1 component alpha subunit
MAPPEVAKEMLRKMYRIRYFEERLKKFYDYSGYYPISSAVAAAKTADDLLTCVSYDFASSGLIGGAVHLYIGQEAVAVGICAHLTDEDAVVSTHRGHGHAIAKGADLKRMLAELMGRDTGYCHGCGGSMHIFSPEIGLMGGNGIVGAGMPIALGPAFAAKYRGTDAVSVAFFGEGGANQGTFHESLNLAALWKLPVLFVCENNLYANDTPVALSLPTRDMAPRAAGYGVPGVVVDGQDVMAVYEASGEAVTRARAGGGPTLIEAKTYRFEGHCGVSSGHQNPDECAEWCRRDPIALFEQRLTADATMGEADMQALRDEVMAEVDEAEAFAKSSPWPEMTVCEA